MRELKSLSLRYEKNQLLVLNQQKLPAEEEWIHCTSPKQMYGMIRSLQVRGAPLIGIAAALALADYAKKNPNISDVENAAGLLKSARPTAVNLAHCLNRQLAALKATKELSSLSSIAEELFFEDAKLCADIAEHGFALIDAGDGILTHCNTGSLVTTGIGTALAVIRVAHQRGKHVHVYIDETRPLLQGARLSTWELTQAKIPYTLLCDNMAASLMQAGKVQKIIVGADRIAKNGDTANKIGTYSLAVLAHYHRIPFYIAAPYTTVDLNCPKGSDIIIEQRDANEVRGVLNGQSELIWSIPDCPVYNPAFDVTPAELITGFILDQGLFNATELSKLKIGRQEMTT